MRSQSLIFPVPHPNRSAQRLDIHRGISPPWLDSSETHD